MENTIPGSLHIANEVLADIVGNAALECYGVVGMAVPDALGEIAHLLPASRLRRGINVTSTPEGAHIDLHIIVEYGTNASVVSRNLQDTVRFVLNEYTKVPIEAIEIHVEGVKVRK